MKINLNIVYKVILKKTFDTEKPSDEELDKSLSQPNRSYYTLVCVTTRKTIYFKYTKSTSRMKKFKKKCNTLQSIARKCGKFSMQLLFYNYRISFGTNLKSIVFLLFGEIRYFLSRDFFLFTMEASLKNNT